MIDPSDDEALDRAAAVQFQRKYRQRLTAHPDCRDPDHPGCKNCEPETDYDPDYEH